MGKEPSESSPERKIYRDQLITLDDLGQFKTELLNELVRVLQPAQPQSKSWLKSAEVRKLLSISPGTLQNLRMNGLLPYSRVGGIIFYKREEILKLLESSKSK